MIKILMAGEFNSITQNVFRSLIPRFHVQFCPAEEELFGEMMNLVSPRLVLVSLVGMQEERRPFFEFLREKYPRMKVLCVGNHEEMDCFGVQLSGEQFVWVLRPVTIQEIIENIYRALDISMGAIAGLRLEDERDRKRVLLVDDSPISLRTVRSFMNREYDVDMATSAQEAMKLIHKNAPDLIFLDYDMPGCDGKQTFEMFKNDPDSCDIPVVFLTGVAERKKVLSVLNMYPAEYLVKPVDRERIMNTAYNILGGKKESSISGRREYDEYDDDDDDYDEEDDD